MPESSEFNRFWTPVFTGVTLLGLLRDHHPCYQESTMGARTRILRPFPPGAHAIRGWDGPRGNVIAASAACPGVGAGGKGPVSHRGQARGYRLVVYIGHEVGETLELLHANARVVAIKDLQNGHQFRQVPNASPLPHTLC